MSKQNTSCAVMARRLEPTDSLDFFPTPAWATRALMEHVTGGRHGLESVLEPAAGEGHMVSVLREYFGAVRASDIHDYGKGFEVRDFLDKGSLFEQPLQRVDWSIFNPPFNLAADFVRRALEISDVGVAALVRTAWAESIDRYEGLFRELPPSTWAVFTERVPMVKGRVDESASSATSYSWVVWDIGDRSGRTNLVWIPPCRKELERPEDYRSAA